LQTKKPKFALIVHDFMRFFSFFFVLWSGFLGFSQIPDSEDLYHPIEKDTIYKEEIKPNTPEENKNNRLKSNDLFYREDQFYLGVTYGLLQKKPKEISQNGFSVGFHFGFLRDIPLNKERNIAVAVGLGYSFYNYKTNLHIAKTENNIEYKLAKDFNKNKISLQFLDLPIEFRWRTSTPKNINFWRIYAGFKLSYLTFNRSQITGNFVTQTLKNNPDLNKLRYGTFLSVGHGSITLYVNYSLNAIFKNAYYTDGKPIDMSDMNLGLMFYIL